MSAKEILFDEKARAEIARGVDALALARSPHSTRTGVEDRALSQLLNEMDGIDTKHGLFVIGVTNRNPGELDAAIKRPGRLELMMTPT